MLCLLLNLVSILSFGSHLCHGMECNDSQVTVPEGQPACILCHIFPHKPSVFSWYRKDRQQPTQLQRDDRIFVDEIGTLYFSYGLPDDSGVYGCSSSINSSILFGKNVTFNVTSVTGSAQTKPKLLWSSGNMTRSNLHPKELVCVFAGRPVPNITWLRNGDIVKTGVQTDGMESTLILSENIPPTTKYTCIGENSAGKEKKDIILFNYRERPLKWIWAGLGVIALVFTLAIGRCCHRWCSWKRRRRTMLRKEAEGHRMVHEEEAEGCTMIREEEAEGCTMIREEEAETCHTSETKEQEDALEGSPKRGFHRLEVDEKLQEKIDNHGLVREEIEIHDNQQDWKGENEVKNAEEIEANLKCVQETDDYGANEEETKNSGKKARETDNHPAEIGQRSADNGEVIGNIGNSTNGKELKEERRNSCGDEIEEMESYGDSAVKPENRRMNEVFAPFEQEKKGSSKDKTEETVIDQGLDDDESKTIGVDVSVGGTENYYKCDRETSKCGKRAEKKETIVVDTDRPGNKTSGDRNQGESEA